MCDQSTRMYSDSTYDLDIDTETVCRLCLEQPAHENIFSLSPANGKFVPLIEIISYTLGIQVSINLKDLKLQKMTEKIILNRLIVMTCYQRNCVPNASNK